MQQQKRDLKVFISDCEGPISKNDNAYEITSHFLPNGEYFFSLISRYDDVLADIVKHPGYRAGYTLKLITPFLKAYGVTNKQVEAYSAENILLISGAKEVLQWIRATMPSFIVSTSYVQYIRSLCELIGFPYENVYCTKLDLDSYPINRTEIKRLKQLKGEITALSMIDIPKEAKSLSPFSKRSKDTIRRLNSIFWEELPRMEIGRMLKAVKPIGGLEKAESVKEIINRVDCDLSDVMYIGDSITDVQAFQLVREEGGLTISFNGNEYAVRNSEITVLSNNAIIIAVLADIFSKYGRQHILNLVAKDGYQKLIRYCCDKTLSQELLNKYSHGFIQVKLVTQDNVDRLVEDSSSFRKTVRGEAIGRLG